MHDTRRRSIDRLLKKLGVQCCDYFPRTQLLVSGQRRSGVNDFLGTLYHESSRINEDVSDADVIISNTSLIWDGAVYAARKGIPHIWWIQEQLFRSPTYTPPCPLEVYERWIGYLSDEVMVGSRSLKEGIRGIPDDKISVIHNALPRKYVEEIKEKSLGERLKIPEGRSVLLTVGNFNPDKGHGFLLDVCKILEEDERFYWVLIGEHNYLYSEIRARADALESSRRILTPGPIENAYEWMRSADLLLLPSESDTYPTVVLEALSQSLPVIARNCGGATEMIDSAGGGRVLKEDTPESMAEEIRAHFGEEPISPVDKNKCDFLNSELMCDAFEELFKRTRLERPIPEMRRDFANLIYGWSKDLGPVYRWYLSAKDFLSRRSVRIPWDVINKVSKVSLPWKDSPDLSTRK